jgi:aryl-alcohol dehydrogenase-like predicted oxidoreductase
VLGLGTVKFGKQTPDDECARILGEALDAGVNLIDTAHVYGRSEEIIGAALAAAGRRDEAFLCTKIQPMANDRATIVAQAEESLRRLRTDRIDLLLLHRPNPAIPIGESLDALDGLVRAGKVRHIGTSGFKAWQILEAVWCSEANGLTSFTCESTVYSLFCRHPEIEILPMCRTYGVGVTVWSPLGGGVLTDRYTRDAPPAHFEVSPREWQIVDTVRDIARAHGCAASQVALAWCIGRPGITTVLAGARTVEQLRDNLGALDVRLTGDDRERLDEVAPPGWTARTQWFGMKFGGPHEHARFGMNLHGS